MGSDFDRLQQMEDNWNNRDSVFEALGVQQNLIRDLAKHRDDYETALDYYLNEGYPQEQAEELASQEVAIESVNQ